MRLAAPVLALLLACAEEREQPAPVECVSWNDEVGPALAAACASCHGETTAEGSYRVTSYLEAIGDGSDDVPNAAAGDSDSLILSVTDPDTGTDPHAGLGETHALLTTWVLECDLARSSSPIHPPGILNPHSDDFHGDLLRESGWDFERCAECHGSDFTGGAADSSCTTCHEEGPTACSTCHDGDLVASGAHDAHLDADMAIFGACDTCHVTPDVWSDEGHLFRDGEVDPHPAEVLFSGLAERDGMATFDADSDTCNNVYCHGDTLDDPAATNTTPLWTGGPDEASCGSCHGIPPADHQQDECYACHGEVIAPDGTFRAPDLHVDGVVQVGGECTSCHGSPDSPAPPRDLMGRTDPSFVTVGTHTSHLEPPFRLRGPVLCADCHVVPDSLLAPGHIDSALPAEVFPGGAAFDGLASARGATPTWNRTAETCADVYCHGTAEPVWTSPSTGQASCGTCHGIPPASVPHSSAMTLTDCADCHTSVDAFGNPVLVGPPEAPTSDHIDGEIDVR